MARASSFCCARHSKGGGEGLDVLLAGALFQVSLSLEDWVGLEGVLVQKVFNNSGEIDWCFAADVL